MGKSKSNGKKEKEKQENRRDKLEWKKNHKKVPSMSSLLAIFLVTVAFLVSSKRL